MKMQSYLTNIVVMMNDIVGVFVAVRFYNHMLTKKSMNEKIRIGGLGGILLLAIALNVVIEKSNVLLIISFGIFFIIAYLFYNGKIHIKMIMAIFIVIFSYLMELIAALVIVAVFGNVLYDIRHNMMLLLLGGIISKILLIFFAEIIIRFRKNNASQVSLRSWLLILSIPVFSVVLSVTSVYEPILKDEFSVISVLACVSIVYINVIVFYLFDSIVFQVNENNQFRFREKQLLIQKNQYENVIDGYNQVKRVRHDMVNHLLVLDGYLANQQYHEALEYIHKLNDELDFGKRGIVSSNVAIDALIGNGKLKAAKEGIDFECEVMIPRKLKIDEMDICIVLGNLLNNAIEACIRIDDERVSKRIMLKMYYKRKYIFLEVENSYDLSTIKKKNGRFVSSKLYREKDEIGIGMGNMEKIVEKYEGVYQIDLPGEMFIVKIMMPDVNKM
ncbi:MAG: GHKL domain-containing protein [Bacillota bacterium]|nr:GHKL domain-containing protein [Bacillota bacterium]